MSLYSRLAESQIGSSLLFGGALFAALAPEGTAEAVAAGAVAACAWFALVPLMKRLAGGLD